MVVVVARGFSAGGFAVPSGSAYDTPGLEFFTDPGFGVGIEVEVVVRLGSDAKTFSLAARVDADGDGLRMGAGGFAVEADAEDAVREERGSISALDQFAGSFTGGRHERYSVGVYDRDEVIGVGCGKVRNDTLSADWPLSAPSKPCLRVHE